MARGVFGSLLIGLGVLVFFFWSLPMWNEISEIKVEQSDTQAILDRVNSLAQKRDEIAAQFNSISDEDRAKLDEFFPRSPESGLLLMNIDSMTASNGMLLKKVEIDEKVVAIQNQQAGTGEADKFSSMPVQILTSGSYNSFLNFLDSLEKSRRLIDINKLTFDSGSLLDGARTVRSDFYEYSINAYTYWKK